MKAPIATVEEEIATLILDNIKLSVTPQSTLSVSEPMTVYGSIHQA